MSKRDKAAEAYLRMIEENIPEHLTPEHLVRIIGGLVTTFAEDKADARQMLGIAMVMVMRYFDDMSPDRKLQ